MLQVKKSNLSKQDKKADILQSVAVLLQGQSSTNQNKNVRGTTQVMRRSAVSFSYSLLFQGFPNRDIYVILWSRESPTQGLYSYSLYNPFKYRTPGDTHIRWLIYKTSSTRGIPWTFQIFISFSKLSLTGREASPGIFYGQNTCVILRTFWVFLVSRALPVFELKWLLHSSVQLKVFNEQSSDSFVLVLFNLFMAWWLCTWNHFRGVAHFF